PDHYKRIAYLTSALRAGADDPALMLELLDAAVELVPARFLSLEATDSPMMPWNERWVVAKSPQGLLTVFDLNSPDSEPEVIEYDVGEDLSNTSAMGRKPRRIDIAIGDNALVDIVPILFDTALLARSSAGDVHLIRLRESGEVALAAVAPIRCRGE